METKNYSNFYAFHKAHPELNCVQASFFWMQNLTLGREPESKTDKFPLEQ